MGRYDMSALVKCEKMDVLRALKGFPNREDFWVALTAVHTEAGRYLRDYTPSVVIYDEETRSDFLRELESVGGVLYSLHVKRAPEVLRNLYDAVTHGDDGSLSDGLGVFYAEMDLLQKSISDALIDEEAVSFKQTAMPIIMLVDDMPEVLASVTEMLIDKYRVIALNSGVSALKALEMQTPSLFLLDIEMPVMNGYTLAKRIRKIERFKKTPLLFISSLGTQEHVIAALQHGANDYLLKPVSQVDLLDKMSQYIPET